MNRENMICLGCLATKVKMFDMNLNGLKQNYNALVGTEVNSDELSQMLCWECASLVHKYNLFRVQCVRARDTLKDVYTLHKEVTEKTVELLDRTHYHHISRYNKIDVHSYDPIDFDNVEEKFHPSDINCDVDSDHYDEPLVYLTTVKSEDVTIDYNDEIKREVEPPQEIEHINTDDMSNLNFVLVKNESDEKRATKKKCKEYSKEKIVEKSRKIKKREKEVAEAKPRFGREKQDISDLVTVIPLTQEQQWEDLQKRKETKNYIGAAFKCTACYKGFLNEQAFNNHMKRHEPASGRYECDVCKIRYSKKMNLKFHIYGVHTTKYVCKSCPYTSYKITNAREHYESHQGVLHKCEICHREFANKSTFKNHRVRSHSREICCVHCGAMFASDLGLKCHTSQRHKDAPAEPPRDPAAACPQCGVHFVSLAAYNRHLVTSKKHRGQGGQEQGRRCRICGGMFTSVREMIDHRAAQHPTMKNNLNSLYKKKKNAKVPAYPVKCSQCDEIMTSGHKYVWHFKRQHPDVVYQADNSVICDVCGVGLRCNSLLQIHMNKHTGEKPYTCAVCSKSFYAPWGLEKHARRHSSNRKYTCDICGDGFWNNFEMKRHRRIHTGEKPYSCDICGQTFNNSSRRNIHKRVVHFKEVIPYLNKSNRQKSQMKKETPQVT